MALIAIKETTIVTIVNHIIVHCQINRVIIAKISWWNCLTFDLYACISSVYERSVGIAALKKTRFAAGKIKASKKKKNDLERIDVEQNDINSFFHLKEKIPFLRMNRIQLWSTRLTTLGGTFREAHVKRAHWFYPNGIFMDASTRDATRRNRCVACRRNGTGRGSIEGWIISWYIWHVKLRYSKQR